MKWLKQLIQDDANRLSSARAIALPAGWSLCLSLVLLTIGSFWKSEMLATVAVLAPSVAGLAGIAYGANRWATKDGKTNDGVRE